MFGQFLATTLSAVFGIQLHYPKNSTNPRRLDAPKILAFVFLTLTEK